MAQYIAQLLFMFNFYVAVFVVFSVIGWVFDATYRYLVTGKWFKDFVIPGFAAPYGFGSVALLLVIQNVPTNAFGHIFIGALCLVAIEFLAGEFCVYVLGRRQWNYSRSRYDLFGHIDILHSFYWLIAATGFRLVYWLVTGM